MSEPEAKRARTLPRLIKLAPKCVLCEQNCGLYIWTVPHSRASESGCNVPPPLCRACAKKTHTEKLPCSYCNSKPYADAKPEWNREAIVILGQLPVWKCDACTCETAFTHTELTEHQRSCVELVCPLCELKHKLGHVHEPLECATRLATLRKKDHEDFTLERTQLKSIASALQLKLVEAERKLKRLQSSPSPTTAQPPMPEPERVQC